MTTLAPSPATHPRQARNLLWLDLVGGGDPRERSGRLRRWSVPEIASVFGVSRQTVHNGIAWARDYHRALDDVAIP